MSVGGEIKTLEHLTLKVPYEVLNKKFRLTQKVLDREAAYVTQAGNDIDKLLSGGPSSSSSSSAGGLPCGTDSGDAMSLMMMMEGNNSEESSSSTATSCSSEQGNRNSGDGGGGGGQRGPKGKEVAKLLGVLVDRLGSLKRKAGESIQDEVEAAKSIKYRVEHLKSACVPLSDTTSSSGAPYTNRETREKQWKRTRLSRLLVDHLLREGLYDTAKLLAEDTGITHLTNVDVFWAAKEVEESLERHETSRMVAWCYENKSKLRKIKSTLELEIRIQEFVELVRGGRRGEAVKYARKYLAGSDEPEHIAAVKRCMGILAFPVETTLPPYADLLSPSRWTYLISLFRQEHTRLYHLSSSTSVLGAVVQSGLAALKTPQCYRPQTKNANCPVCTEPLAVLASNLPFAHCAHSQLVCAISGEPLNEHNPPLVLPNGYVYGTNSLQEMSRNNGGKVICPRTSKVFAFAETEKVYVM